VTAIRMPVDSYRVRTLDCEHSGANSCAPETIFTNHGGRTFVGESPKLHRALAQVSMVAPTSCTVLIQGETGTGKEIIAERIHNLSPRRDHTFLKVNCAAIPSPLLESELFGHEKGAFTGAVIQRKGRFEVADKGTVFLDEIGDTPQELQPKLLRVLQERQFERVGSSRTIASDVRIVAASNQNLTKLVTEGRFRADLFYRISVFPITLPPLRERQGDIPLLVRHFVEKFARRLNRRTEIIPPHVMEVLTGYPWPGNVRELQNFIERSVILSAGPVLDAPLAELLWHSHEASAEPTTLKEAERAHISRMLREADGQLSRAASLLGIPRTTLFYKMRRLGIGRLIKPNSIVASQAV
jgi:formate hydrogenlyase transcriptional activator